MRAFLTFVCVCLVCVTNAQDEVADETKTIAEAKEAFEREIDKAKQELVVAMESLIREVAETGNLDEVESLLKQLDSLKTDGSIPSTQRLLPAAKHYKEQIRRNVLAVKGVFDQLIMSHTRRLEVDQARIIQGEREQFLKKHSNVERGVDAPKGIDLSKTQGLTRESVYDDPRLPHTWETWHYKIHAGSERFPIIHATEGEAFMAFRAGGPFWYKIAIDKEGYFYFQSANATGIEQDGIFNIKRYRP